MYMGTLGAFSFASLMNDIKQVAQTAENVVKPAAPTPITAAAASASPMTAASGGISPILLYGGIGIGALVLILALKKKK